MKVPQGLSRIEQETFFRTHATSEEWDFYTRDPKFKRLVERRGYTVTEDQQGFWAVKIPRNKLTVRNAVAVRRKLSDEERAFLRSRLHPVGKKNNSESPNDVPPVPEIEP